MTAAPVAYRLATAADALCVGVLAMQVYLDTYATEGIRPDIARDVLVDYTPDAYARRLVRPDARTMLAERAGHLLGFAEVRLNQPCPVSDIACTVELDRLYVQRHVHRQGIGAALLRQAEAMAQQHGAGGLWLTAWSGNANALAFYPRQGYKAVGTAQHWIEGIAYENVVFFKQSA